MTSPITPNSLLWLKFSSGSLTPKKTNFAGKGLHLEPLKGVKQCSRSAGEPGIEPRCPWPCWTAGAPRLQKIFISFRSSCSLLPHPAPPKQPHHEVTECTLACGWWEERAARPSESHSVCEPEPSWGASWFATKQEENKTGNWASFANSTQCKATSFAQRALW